MNHGDIDAEFERIVSGWDVDADEPKPRDDVMTPRLDPTRPVEPSSHSDSGLPASGAEADGSGAAAAAGPGAGPAPEPHETGLGDPGDAASAHPEQNAAINPPLTFDFPIAPDLGPSPHVWRGSAAADASGPASGDALEADDHFVPDEPDLPSVEDDPMYWAIVVGLAGGPLLLLYVLLFDRGGSPWWIVTGAAMTVVGFVMLVLRGGDHRDPFDDGSRV